MKLSKGKKFVAKTLAKPKEPKNPKLPAQPKRASGLKALQKRVY